MRLKNFGQSKEKDTMSMSRSSFIPHPNKLSANKIQKRSSFD
jgi:hypothetical protein